MQATVAVGSSIDAQRHVLCGLRRLDERLGILRLSTFWWTPAIPGPTTRGEQPEFLNGLAVVHWRADGADELRAIEAAEGRVRSADRYAPRTLDLDLLLKNGQPIAADPQLRTRRFLACGLIQLHPGLRLLDGGGPLVDPGGMPMRPEPAIDLAAVRTIAHRDSCATDKP
jgi:2-amino-4-hydroxy-6-hydroxymethyldihydropteridine diphosphokinase